MNLTYADCKELKDAGFPQGDELSSEDFLDLRGTPATYEEFKKGDSKIGKIKNPTLSELIEACDGKLAHLGDKAGIDNQKWRAWSFIVDDISHDVSGKTPEQAVKQLWLALNKK